MLYKAEFLETVGETRIQWTSNTYSDAWPMLRHVSFRKLPIDLNTQSVALATALLTRTYCGDIFEFAGLKIGSDYSEAIRCVLGQPVNILGVDGHSRNLAISEISVLTGKAGETPAKYVHAGQAPLARVDWSGDFVDQTSRSSAGFAFGAVQTNAAFFAAPFLVSVAIGLLFGRDRCASLTVSTPAENRRQYNLVRDALGIVGIGLEGRIAQTDPELARAN
jgi:hypothetical protein